jgi:hypothetical protein
VFVAVFDGVNDGVWVFDGVLVGVEFGVDVFVGVNDGVDVFVGVFVGVGSIQLQLYWYTIPLPEILVTPYAQVSPDIIEEYIVNAGTDMLTLLLLQFATVKTEPGKDVPPYISNS